MKKTIFILAALLAPGCLHAQNPKWFKKAAKAQITVMTLDGQGQMLQSGSGFFIGEDGTALADFELFKRAQKATGLKASALVEALLEQAANKILAEHQAPQPPTPKSK